MVEPVSLLAGPIIKKILTDSYTFAQNKYTEVYNVEREIELLRSDLTAIAAVVADAERYCSRSRSEQLADWLTKVKDVALETEDILEMYATEAALRKLQRHPGLSAWLRSRFTAAKKIKKIVKRMEHISRQRSSFHFNPPNYGGEWTSSPIRVGLRETNWRREASEVVGRAKEKEDILSWFSPGDNDNTGERVAVFAITGMGGVGKTTLAQQVYNDDKVYKKASETSYFKHAVWVNVSVSFSVDKILKEMVEGLTEIPHNNVSRNIMETSILNVLDGKPFLLVLDDVWGNESLSDWKDLHKFVSSCPRGSKVLVTSRSEQVAEHVGAIRRYTLSNLPEDECWNLFKSEVLRGTSTSEDDLEDKEQTGREIIRKCDFLPLAVKSMAAALRGKPIQDWTDVLQNGIWETDEAHREDGSSYILPALKLSYDYLPSSLLKQCFAYCSIFPKGHMFAKIELVKLWIAEGYISSLPSGVHKLEDVGAKEFEKLLSRSFFQSLDIDSKERYKMHDLIHDLAKSVAISSQQIEENRSNIIKQNCLHVSFLCKDVQKHVVDDMLRVKKLRTLLLPVSWPRDFNLFLDQMFKTLKYLRVLDLSSSLITDLPSSIGNLKLLHYLDLSRTDIRVLPSIICDLLKLQVLKLLGCLWLKELPKDLGNLKELRYLELDEIFWYKCSALPPKIGGLINLHNLHCFHVQGKSGYGIEELKNMNNLEGSLHISKLENADNARDAEIKQKEGITKLTLEWSKDALAQDQEVQESILDNLETPNNLKELHLLNYKGSRFSSWMGTGVLQNLFKISLKNCANCRIFSLGPLPHLQQLIIKGMLELEEWPISARYDSLTRLTIINCPKLQKLPHISFLSLGVMEIKKCHALRALPLAPNLKFLKVIDNGLLEDLSQESLGVLVDKDLDGPDDLKTVEYGELPVKLILITKEIEGLEDGQFAIIFYNLIELTVSKCPMLAKLSKNFAPQKLTISDCPLLTTLPDQQHSQRFQYLELDGCNGSSLIKTMQSSPSLDSLTISNIGNMAALPKLPHLPKLLSLYISNCQDLMSLSHEEGLLRNFTALRFLSISGCPNLVKFAEEGLPTSIGCLIIKNCPKLQSLHGRNNNFLASLTSLKDLYLEDCPKLESLPEDGLPASLEHLCIRGCPLLIQQCNKDAGGRYWQKISHVIDIELDSIETRREPEPSLSASKRFLAMFKHE